MDRGSVIEAQLTYKEEVNNEIGRCKDSPIYFYYTYCTINGQKVAARASYKRVNRLINAALKSASQRRTNFYLHTI